MKKQIAINEIVFDKRLQPRAKGLSRSHVADLAELDEASLPAPVVWLIHGKVGFFLTSGFHTVSAAEKKGRKRIECEVKNGDWKEAVLHAVGTNTDHGLKRLPDDKRRVVKMALAVDPGLSNRAIADVAAVSPTFVGEIRGEVSTVDTSQQENKPKRKGRDGKLYPSANPKGTETGTPPPEKPEKPGKSVKELHAELVKRVKFLPIRSKADEWLADVVKLAEAVASEIKEA